MDWSHQPATLSEAMNPTLSLPLLVAALASQGLATAADSPTNSWAADHLTAARQSLERLKADGLITARQLERKAALLADRQAGRFKSTALAQSDPAELNFLQNAGFEEINKNSNKNRSRWLWWGGWSWGGDYENFWESRPQYVHSGSYSAGIRCTGKAGRIGISTPKLPIVPGLKEYLFTVWAKGEGDNQVFLNFESGATGSLRKKVGPEWEQVSLKGSAEAGAQNFTFYIYVTGEGTIWFDDAKLVPLGEMKDE
jgi:hypothetical protein